MNFCTKEEQIERAAQAVAGRREAAATFPLVREVVRRFDGKVFNCRFEKALQEALQGAAPGHVYVNKNDYWLTVRYHAHATPGYNYPFTLCQLRASEMPDGKRLDGKALYESLTACRAALLREAAAIEEQAAKADEYREQIEQMKRTLEHLTGSITITVRDIFNLNYRMKLD